MPRSRFALRPALALLGTLALLCLAACTPTARPATVGHASTATPTTTTARVPAGWKVLTTAHFRLAYPPDWTPVDNTNAKYYPGTADTEYLIESPDHHPRLDVRASPSSSLPDVAHAEFCRATPVASPITQQFQPTTLAGLPMYYLLVPYPNGGGIVRWWVFWNAQYTSYILRAFDGDANAATQTQDDAILATFRPDNATPLQC